MMQNLLGNGIRLIWLLAALGCSWIVFTTPVVADLTLFVPRADPVAELLLKQLRSGPTTRLILIGLSGDEENVRADASQQLALRLPASGRFSRVENGADVLPDTELALLYTHRYLLSPKVTSERFTADALRTALQQRLQELASPLAVLHKRWLPGDPTGELFSLLQVWSTGIGAPAKRRGVWFSPDGARALLLVETHASGYDLAAQRDAVNAIRTAFAEVAAGTDLELAMSGPGVLATLAEDQIRAEAAVLSTLAIAAMVLILIGVYRSARTVWLGALPMLSALLTGAAAVDLLFGQMYMITLAFSMTLLGETLDYPTYLFSHRQAGETVTDTLRQLWPTLRLCVATTLLGCLAMLVGDFPGLSQLGVFTMVGIVAAVAATRWLLPALLPTDWTPPRPATPGPWADRLLKPRPKLALAIGLGGLALLLFLWVKAPPLWEDNLAVLSPVPRDLLQLDRQLRRALGAPEVGHLIVMTAPDAETALQHGERLAAWLDVQQAAGLLDGYDGAMRYLPSQATQRQRQDALPTPAILATRLESALEGLPFKPGLFAPFLDAVNTTRTALPITPEDLRGTLLATRVDALLSPDARGWTALLPLSGVRDPGALAASLPDWPDSHAYYLDLRAETSRLVAGFREQALIRLGWGALLIIGVVWIGLRSWRRTIAALLPVWLGLIVDVAALLALGERLTLFHLVSLLLVFGIGVDYGLFFSRPAVDAAARRRTLHALLVCCGSALTVFGLLSVSTLPALRAIGLTVSLGVAASFVAALLAARPLSLQLFERVK
ncbi:MAG: MMPL family transporter [Candidatus Competibacteraceae bacterium]|nr:MMPL family transporter [Candidatus Competibacteraceae bacterium]